MPSAVLEGDRKVPAVLDAGRCRGELARTGRREGPAGGRLGSGLMQFCLCVIVCSLKKKKASCQLPANFRRLSSKPGKKAKCFGEGRGWKQWKRGRKFVVKERCRSIDAYPA